MLHRGERPGLNRRDFLALGGLALGGAVAACGRGQQSIEVTAVPTPGGATPVAPTASPRPSTATDAAADTILVNGNVVTMDAKRSAKKFQPISPPKLS
jgi:hypothetical protein